MRTQRQAALRNFRHNQLPAGAHRFLQADVVAWLKEPSREKWDVILLDPPSFSNSKRMQTTFDIQRDHAPLLAQTLELLAPGGELIFSTNRQGFRLDPAVQAEAAAEEISRRTVPPDFARHTPHRCWLLRRD